MTWIVVLGIRPLAIAAVAWLILRVFRVAHPASQHAVWTGALAGMVLLAPLSLVMPRWSVALRPARETVPMADVSLTAARKLPCPL